MILLTESFCNFSPLSAALGKVWLVYSFSGIMNETIAYTLLLFLYCNFCLGFIIGMPTILLLFDLL
jgi:hypothetical protein